MEKTFSHLRVSSEYSITQGLLTINQLVDCAKKYSVPSIALTDKSNMFAMVKFFNKCESQGIKPISGSLVCGGLLTFIKNREERQNNADELFKLIINGILKIDINQRYKLKDIAIAHDEVEARITTGSSIILP